MLAGGEIVEILEQLYVQKRAVANDSPQPEFNSPLVSD